MYADIFRFDEVHTSYFSLPHRWRPSIHIRKVTYRLNVFLFTMLCGVWKISIKMMDLSSHRWCWPHCAFISVLNWSLSKKSFNAKEKDSSKISSTSGILFIWYRWRAMMHLVYLFLFYTASRGCYPHAEYIYTRWPPDHTNVLERLCSIARYFVTIYSGIMFAR